MNRRLFFRAMSSAVIAAPVLIAHQRLPAVELSAAAKLPKDGQAPKPRSSADERAEFAEILRGMAWDAAEEIERLWVLPKALQIVNTEFFMQSGDTVNIPLLRADGRLGNAAAVLTFYKRAEASVPDYVDLWKPHYAKASAVSCALEIAEYVTRVVSATGARYLVQAKQRTPMPGLGAFGVNHNSDNVALRAVAFYEPRTLAQTITFDMLFGTSR